MSSQIGPTNQAEIKLHYIDKLHTVLLATGEAVNRVYLWQCVLCIIVLVLSLRIVSVDKKLSLGSLTFIVSSPYLVVGLSILIAATFAYLAGLIQHLSRSRDLIVSLYKEVGYTITAQHSTHPLEYPDITSVIADIPFGRSFLGIVASGLNHLALYVTLLILPLITQIAACWFLSATLGWSVLLAGYALLVLFNVLSNCYALVSSFRPSLGSP